MRATDSMTFTKFKAMGHILARNGLHLTLRQLVDDFPSFREKAREEWVGMGRGKTCPICGEALDFFGGVGSTEDPQWVVICSACKTLYEED